MTRIAFFEPDYMPHDPRDWAIRGGYRYPSLLGDLASRADLSILMSVLPPADDPYRQILENDHGVRFAEIESCEDPGWAVSALLTAEYAAAIAEHAPAIVSTLNGRMIGINFAIAQAARAQGAAYVYRVAGNDIATQGAVCAAAGRPFDGTAFEATMSAQESFAVAAARTVIVMGGTEHARLSRQLPDPAKLHICRRGVDRSHFSPPAWTPERCTRVLFVGRDSPEKGIDLIEAAAERLAGRHPDIRFTIAGDFEGRETGNRRYLGFHGYDALPDLYRSHHLLVLPARSEGFPQVVMEAMSCGLPAVLSRDLFAEDFDGEANGVCLTELDADTLAAALARVHDDAALFAGLREAALAHAAAHFDEAVNRPFYHAALIGEAV